MQTDWSVRWGGVARVDARVEHAAKPDSVLTVRMNRHSPRPWPEPDETLLARLLIMVDARVYEGLGSFERYPLQAQAASPLARWVGESEVPDFVVDWLMATYLPGPTVVGALSDHCCRVGIRGTDAHETRDGMVLTMTSTPGAPVELLPALLECWIGWRLSEGGSDAEELAEWVGPKPTWRIPMPPARLNLIEGKHQFAVRLHDVEHTYWPRLPG